MRFRGLRAEGLEVRNVFVHRSCHDLEAASTIATSRRLQVPAELTTVSKTLRSQNQCTCNILIGLYVCMCVYIYI